jgi:hypothetical protein
MRIAKFTYTLLVDRTETEGTARSLRATETNFQVHYNTMIILNLVVVLTVVMIS